MTRYTTPAPKRERAWDWYDDPPLISAITVDEHVAVDTGLVDAKGLPIMRLPNPIGFGRDADW